MRRCFPALFLAFAACTAPQVATDLGQESPPPELGRPGWVRFSAATGAWVGAGVGAVASVVLLPITWPISLLADEPLGYSKQEFLFLPVSFASGFGHFFLGAPTDSLDFVFYRAWAGNEQLSDYELTPQAPPQGPYSEAPPGTLKPGSASKIPGPELPPVPEQPRVLEQSDKGDSGKSDDGKG